MPGERLPVKHLDWQSGAASPFGNTAMGVETIPVLNNQGSAVARGDVVVVDWTNSTKNQLKFKTTTSGTDLTVLGVVYDQSIAASAIGRIQIFGPHDSVHVDGTTDIAVGDRLVTFTTAKIAQKAATATGQPGVFATAMAAYTADDSLGSIAAFISRRQFANQQ